MSIENKKYHHGNLSDALIKESLQIIEEQQTVDISVRELSRRIGVSANAAYKHFANKDELLTAVAAQGFQQLLLAQANAIAPYTNHDYKQAFIEGGKAYVYFAMAHPTLFRLMFSRFAVSQRDTFLNQMARTTYEGMKLGVSLSAGKKDEKEVTLLAMKSWSKIHGLSYLIIDGHFDGYLDQIDEFISEIVR